MPEPPLDGPGVVAFIGEGVAAGVAKHVGMGSMPALACIAPNIPTAAELGLPTFTIAFWWAMFAPKGTPKSIIERLIDALADDRVRARLAELGQEIFPRAQQTPQSLRDLQRSETDRWWPIIKAAGIRIE
jgi:tripartite-type tricarboxylate transporter receptor subunit TctC